MIYAFIRADLRRILLSVPGIPASAIKWEGKGFSPNPDVAWVSERLDPVSAETATLGMHGSIEERAIYAVDVFGPAVQPVSDVQNLADAIRLTFWPGRGIGATTPVAMWGNVQSAEIRTPIESPQWYQIPVRIMFFVRRPSLMSA